MNLIFRYCIILGLRYYYIPKVKLKYIKTWYKSDNYINKKTKQWN